eukprot:790428-Pyramimonas_sp.AAC.1
MPPIGPKRATKRFQVLSETPQDPPKAPNPSKTYGQSMICAFSPFRFRRASEASSWPQDYPRPQEGPKRPPRRPQERPRTLQEGPKSAPRD